MNLYDDDDDDDNDVAHCREHASDKKHIRDSVLYKFTSNLLLLLLPYRKNELNVTAVNADPILKGVLVLVRYTNVTSLLFSTTIAVACYYTIKPGRPT